MKKKQNSVKDRIAEKLSSVKTWAFIAGFISLWILFLSNAITGESLGSKLMILIPGYFVINLGQKAVLRRGQYSEDR